jgi:hypothetical protein
VPPPWNVLPPDFTMLLSETPLATISAVEPTVETVASSNDVKSQ